MIYSHANTLHFLELKFKFHFEFCGKHVFLPQWPTKSSGWNFRLNFMAHCVDYYSANCSACNWSDPIILYSNEWHSIWEQLSSILKVASDNNGRSKTMQNFKFICNLTEKIIILIGKMSTLFISSKQHIVLFLRIGRNKRWQTWTTLRIRHHNDYAYLCKSRAFSHSEWCSPQAFI